MAHGTQLAEDVHLSASVKPESIGISHWKSEEPVVAMKSGNADGAKRFWFGIVYRCNKDRPRAGRIHDHNTGTLHTEGARKSNDAVHVPDGNVVQYRGSFRQL